ncbi:hypothetical protein RHGRI_024160 [Rhododendron griersonianum]|uniref:Uncharacterized protein n=1 Tax=Rhododendron griersonianum TaxID=479676 RepID=A0AAV6J668_9ERIC|nr:hypothetical protein RHGRI_024160 [Rhododendron griersonianum]
MADYAAKMLNKVALIHKEAQEKKAMVAGKTRGRNAQGRGARCKAPCNWNCSEEAWVPWLLEMFARILNPKKREDSLWFFSCK